MNINQQQSIERRRTERQLVDAARTTKSWLTTVFMANAALTVVFVFLVVYHWWFPASAGPPSVEAYMRFGLAAAALAIVTSLLTDVARFAWYKARIARGINRGQQILGLVMEIVTFLGSSAASVIAIEYIWSLIAQDGQASSIANIQWMSLLVRWSLAANIGAVFIYSLMSPASRKIQKLSDSYALLEEYVTEEFQNVMADSHAKLKAEMQPYMRQIVEQETKKLLGGALKEMGLVTESTRPPIVVRPPVRKNGVVSVSSAEKR